MINLHRSLLWALMASFLVTTVTANTPHQLEPILLASMSGVDMDDPTISGNIVVFEDTRARPGTTLTDVNGIHWDTGEEFAIANNSKIYESHPQIDGTIVIWNESKERVGYISGMDLSTGSKFEVISTESPGQKGLYFPQISGDLVVWTNGSLSVGDIWGKYLSGGNAFPIVTDSLYHDSVCVSGNLVVWSDIAWTGNVGYGVGIRAKDLSNGEIFEVSSSGSSPDVSGDIIVWQDYSGDPEHGSDIMGMNVVTGEKFSIASGLGNQRWAKISGENVIWLDYELGGIVGKNLRTGYEFMAPGTHAQMDIDGNRLVWAMPVDGDWRIYGAVIPEPSTVTLLGLGTLTLLIRRRKSR